MNLSNSSRDLVVDDSSVDDLVRADIVADSYSVGQETPHAFNLNNSFASSDLQAVIASFLVHIVALLALALVPIGAMKIRQATFLQAMPEEAEEEFTLVEHVAVSEDPADHVGANSEHSERSMALSSAPVLAELSELSTPSFEVPSLAKTFVLTNQIQQAVALTRSDTLVKGMTGVGTTGTDGAVDLITGEILNAMEERPTLVVWFFDQSGSLLVRRQEIRDRFDRIYEELAIVQKSAEELGRKQAKEQPLLTSVVAFGQSVNLLTTQPTSDLDEIKAAIDSITMDTSGVEKVFTAISAGVQQYRRYRGNSSSLGPQRNVLFIVVTDERGDDDMMLESTLKDCQKYGIPVHVVGVPAPFGRKTTYIKYIDPDPNYDQSPQWAEVDQGPESFYPERVQLGYKVNYYQEPVIDSGFGPYALSRLAYETGGIYFNVHPNRKVGRRVQRNTIAPFASDLDFFVDPEIMAKYRPDYLAQTEYMSQASKSPIRQALISASQQARVDTLDSPVLRFVKRDEASLAVALTEAQLQSARLAPQLAGLVSILKAAEDARDREASPRWLAGFDLSLGTVLAHYVRAEVYNEMLAKAKRGQAFADPKNNTWNLRPDDEISVGRRLEKEKELATELLERVVREHAGTPWSLLAAQELNHKIGWKWEESFTDLDPPRENNRNNNNNPRPPRDDQARMLEKPLPKRPHPKL
ncbi:MAG: VWA domain-containing protein [Planctomycetales bacterium]|nr:VWA domain-containing protein [Planctomycetales bacterium]